MIMTEWTERPASGRTLSVHVMTLGLVMAGRAGTLERDDLDALAAVARRQLVEGDYLRAAIDVFCAEIRPLLHDPRAQAAPAERLSHALDVALAPVPPGQDRADTNG